MATVSISGSGSLTDAVDVGSDADAALGVALASSMVTAIAGRAVVALPYIAGQAVASGQNGVFVTSATVAAFPAAVTAIVVAGNAAATLSGAVGVGHSILAGQGGIELNTGGGSGTVVAGGGNNLLANGAAGAISPPMVVEDFNAAASDRTALEGYGGDVAGSLFGDGAYQPPAGGRFSDTLAASAPTLVTAGGTTFITLPDGTEIVLVSVGNPPLSAFA